MKNIILLSVSIFLFSCSSSSVKKENRHLVDAIDQKVNDIDHNHRVRIVEDDFVEGDKMYKVRAYYTEGLLQKLVGITKSPHFERDDYFYFENHHHLFTGHMINFKDEKLAEEFKYYYHEGEIVECLFWEDHYKPGKRFPHEHFDEFEPNMDSLYKAEDSRLEFFLNKIDKEGFTLKQINDNLEANSRR